MICPTELARNLSAFHGKGCKVRSEVINAERAVPDGRSGADDEGEGNCDASDVETDHVVAGGGSSWCEHSDHATDEKRMAEGGIRRPVRPTSETAKSEASARKRVRRLAFHLRQRFSEISENAQ